MNSVDSLFKYVLQKHTYNISTKFLGPVELLSVQVSFVISTLVDLD